ncbi:phospholipase d gamma 1 [Phtheirospermum japonicum]|uniref:phospholipase D n=1 Tax=Phtheirospermum japonicum TaxID=374723 RepID=A0A830D6J5_9LAMI|nr:phospholipase d gamma 1 [Phtheirospermum japonicum]
MGSPAGSSNLGSEMFLYTLFVFLADDPYVTNSNLEELLKVKSQEAVFTTFYDVPHREGVMNTGDDETHRYFKHSSVKVILCPRIAVKGSWAKKQEQSTHHRKSVIVDTASTNYGRKIVAFFGGLDLCKGRYDTPQHLVERIPDIIGISDDASVTEGDTES